jgi:hypothetical protein
MMLWPFELPFAPMPREALEDVRIVVSEVYPSILETTVGANEVRDEAQVRATAEWFADLDARGKLAELFGPNHPLTDAQKSQVTTEEGWILGI